MQFGESILCFLLDPIKGGKKDWHAPNTKNSIAMPQQSIRMIK